MSDQDWTPVVLRKELKSAPKTASGLAAAKSKGQVDTVKKDHVTNQKAHGAGVNGVKLDDNEVTDYKHATVTHDFKLALSQARAAKGWSQKDLALKLNVQPAVIASYENGKAIPQAGMIQLFNRTLGVTLPKIPKKKIVHDEDED